MKYKEQGVFQRYMLVKIAAIAPLPVKQTAQNPMCVATKSSLCKLRRLLLAGCNRYVPWIG